MNNRRLKELEAIELELTRAKGHASLRLTQEVLNRILQLMIDDELRALREAGHSVSHEPDPVAKTTLDTLITPRHIPTATLHGSGTLRKPGRPRKHRSSLDLTPFPSPADEEEAK